MQRFPSFFWGAIIGIMFLGSIAEAQNAKASRSIAITKDFVETELKWQDIPKPGFIIRFVSVVNARGYIEICGAVRYPSAHTKTQSKRVLKRTSFSVNDKVLLRDMTFFQVTKNGKPWKTANCAKTKMKAPRKGYQYLVSWGGGRDRF